MKRKHRATTEKRAQMNWCGVVHQCSLDLVKCFRLFVLLTNKELFWTAWLLICSVFELNIIYYYLSIIIYICMTVSKLLHNILTQRGLTKSYSPPNRDFQVSDMSVYCDSLMFVCGWFAGKRHHYLALSNKLKLTASKQCIKLSSTTAVYPPLRWVTVDYP